MHRWDAGSTEVAKDDSSGDAPSFMIIALPPLVFFLVTIVLSVFTCIKELSATNCSISGKRTSKTTAALQHDLRVASLEFAGPLISTWNSCTGLRL
ncbi:hypothetical protein PISMIDRAFT_679135 [Pisolithus microcarpus 441]|uniref:Uncharacterized protein n=1 Tax=Pisolithus microcarpus 441 TaxID=765257 RepID=A0A0C9ZMR9_9AGAM|nr:hypothetical protein PISMIDRAFT_679135 [Pisolithus microcarpus 441]